MSRRLRQRADGPDQRRQLRGPHRGEHGRDPGRARGRQEAQAWTAGRSPDELPGRWTNDAPEDGRAQLRLSPAVDSDGWGGDAVKDIVKIIVAILVIVIVWKILKGLIGLLVGLAVAGLVVYGVVKLVDGQKRIK